MSTLELAPKKPITLDEQVASIVQGSYLTALTRIKQIVANEDGYGPDQIRLILEQAQTREVRAENQRPAVRQALRNALKKLNMSSKSKSANVEVTNDSPLDPAWDAVRQTAQQLHAVGRLWLRGQVRLGMQLAALKKEVGSVGSGRRNKVPESGTFLPWADRVKQETGYSRQSCDEFIRLYEATVAKLKKSKKLDLPAAAKKSALVIFQDNSALTLTDEQWALVDDVIGTLTTGETQASLMQALKLIPTPQAMPDGRGKGSKGAPKKGEAGQLAFHFFEAVANPLINARSNPDYKKLLYALPFESDDENPLSLSGLKAEFQAAIADIEEVEAKAHTAARGKTITI